MPVKYRVSRKRVLESSYQAGANDFMKDKSETAFGFNPKVGMCPQMLFGEELILNELGYKSENLLNFRNFSWYWDETESFCGDL